MTRKTLRLLLSLVKDNRRVKAQLFYSINVLLEVKCAVKHLTELLKEVRANIGLSNICVYRASLAVFKLLPTVHVLGRSTFTCTEGFCRCFGRAMLCAGRFRLSISRKYFD